jgi:hypothetical protein
VVGGEVGDGLYDDAENHHEVIFIQPPSSHPNHQTFEDRRILSDVIFLLLLLILFTDVRRQKPKLKAFINLD